MTEITAPSDTHRDFYLLAEELVRFADCEATLRIRPLRFNLLADCVSETAQSGEVLNAVRTPVLPTLSAPGKCSLDNSIEQLSLLNEQSGDQYVDGLNQLYKTVYNRSSQECVLSNKLRLREVPSELQGQITNWLVLSDRSIAVPQANLRNRRLQPVADFNAGDARDQGRMYAVGFNKYGLPLNVIDYYPDGFGRVNYARQWTISYSPDSDGGSIIQIRQYKNMALMAGSTDSTRDINGIANALIGVTTYHQDHNSNIKSVTLCSGKDNGSPLAALIFTPECIRQFRQDVRTGRTKESTLYGQEGLLAYQTLKKEFYFFDLFGR